MRALFFITSLIVILRRFLSAPKDPGAPRDAPAGRQTARLARFLVTL
jgi:hypothetical protein